MGTDSKDIPSKILGIGSHVPSNIIDNNKLSESVDTSDEWITTRTGIKQRCFANEQEATSDLAFMAAQNALDAQISPNDIDLIIVATITPDMAFPSTACLIQHKLGIPKVTSFDVEAACSGFLYALDIADGMLKSGRYNRALVVGAENSQVLWIGLIVLHVFFGDGAGAVILSKEGDGLRLIGFNCGADGSNSSSSTGWWVANASF